MAASKWPAVIILIAIHGCSSGSNKQLNSCEGRFSSFFAPQIFFSAEYFLSAETRASSASSDKTGLIKAIALTFGGAAEAPQSGVSEADNRVVQMAGKVADPVNVGCKLEKRGFRLYRIIARDGSHGSTMDVAIHPDR